MSPVLYDILLELSSVSSRAIDAACKMLQRALIAFSPRRQYYILLAFAPRQNVLSFKLQRLRKTKIESNARFNLHF